MARGRYGRRRARMAKRYVRRHFNKTSRRFKRKNFSKNSVSLLKQNAPLAARSMYVKLPWVKSYNPSVGANSSVAIAIQGNAIVPYTDNGQNGSGGLGNVVTTGDQISAGGLEYAQFYDRYTAYGSSIKIEAMPGVGVTGGSNNNVFKACLFAVPFTGFTGATGTAVGTDSWPNVIDQLLNYTYEQLLSWPGAQWRMVSFGAGQNRLKFKMFRKTKSMCGITNVNDNAEYSGYMPDNTVTGLTGNAGVNPTHGFMYYLRFFNQSGAATPVDLIIRMKTYFKLTSREFNIIRPAL